MEHGQQHPVSLYLIIWGLLFILSACSYLVDYLQVQGALRWTLVMTFMLYKAGLIVCVFMHMAWERLALVCAILLPPLCLLLLASLMAFEAEYIFNARGTHFAAPVAEEGQPQRP
ncbi:cytochrome C oxidase subunit IV family protein [Jeongeupia sp. USM3]|uniref:cytochrome C oxidase subunit IV family protein n=1 Tax=Jeongeupia sp. USM3 TaxID=1906741 RepID=UPI00089DEFD6|nr:cytochrome C oxidase subunit IV family protein [Jeongeupia sp. USM3]AOX99520.1 cytochrome C oxidase subunit IV [Jeongeupia sp. USM3]